MKFRQWKFYIRFGVTVFCVTAASLLFYFVLFHMDLLRAGWSRIYGILLPLIYGAAMAYIFSPVVTLLEQQIVGRIQKKIHKRPSQRSKKVARLVCVLITIVFVLLCVYGLMAMLIPQLAESLTSIIDNFPSYISNIQQWFLHLFRNNPEVESSVNEFFDKYSAMAEQWMTGEILPRLNDIIKDLSMGVMGFVVFMKNLILGLIISIYILYSKESLFGNAKKALYAFFTPDTATQVIRDVQYVDKTFGGYLIGMILDSVNIGIMCYIGTTVLNLPYALLISVIVAVTNVIPFFGPYLGGIPSTLLIFMVNPLQAFYFVIFIFVLQQIDGNFIAPRILSGATGLTSFMVIVAIILGGGFFGIPGMLIGVPVCAVICTIMKNFVEGRLRARKLPVERGFYASVDHVDPCTGRGVHASKTEIRPEDVFRYHGAKEAVKE